ncbi:hypothetical protein, partial [Actinobacillus porcinus]|uniref:hypothetical protein n=1 Tax=Actinobacillus porcinus TaxID=51048 RepID=UPI002356EE9A
MNKIFMTKRRNDGKIVVCSELTRARGKMKSVVTAVVAATLSVGGVGEALADLMPINMDYADYDQWVGEDIPFLKELNIPEERDNRPPVMKITPNDGIGGIGYVYGSNEPVSLDENASKTLILFTGCNASRDDGGMEVELSDPSCADMGYLVFQDTDNTTTVSSKNSFLKVESKSLTDPKDPKVGLNKAQGIGYNTDYELTFNYNTTTLGVDGNGNLTVLPVYFHVNDNTTTQGVGNATTNLGALTDKAGATGKFSVTAGVNVTAKGEGAFAAGYNVTTVGNGGITIGDSSNVSTTMVEWVASNTKNDKNGDKGVYYTKITTTKNGNQVTVTREIYKDTNNLAKVTRGDRFNPEKITDVDVTGLTPVTFAEANQTTSTGASGTASIAMGADKIPMDLSLVELVDGTIKKDGRSDVSKIAIINRSPITVARGQEISNNDYAERITTSMQDINWAPTASGEAAVAIGAKTTAQGNGTIALGALATALPENSIAIGVGALTRSKLNPYSKGVQARESVAIGYLATAENQGSVALGTEANALHDQALALGAKTYASGFNSAAIGNNNKATGYGAFVIGGDDAGKKDVASNKIEGANTEYATLFYNPVTGEVVSNSFIANKLSSAPSGVTGANVYKVRTVDITGEKTQASDALQYVINGEFTPTEQKIFSDITGKGLKAKLLVDENEKATLIAKGYTILNKDDFASVEELALKIGDPIGYVSGMIAQYKALFKAQFKAQGKNDTEAETAAEAEITKLKPELYKQLMRYTTSSVYSEYQEATSSGVGSIAFGLKTQATQDGAIAMGVASNARAKESIAVGVGTVTTGDRAVSVGSRSIASGERSIA